MQQNDEPANVSLVRQGLLGCSPVVPTVAISLKTLELVHRLRRRHPQLGIQAIVWALCDIHAVGCHLLHPIFLLTPRPPHEGTLCVLAS